MSEASEKARKLFTQDCVFIVAASEPKLFPVSDLSEVAFIGRSNVGKSSLLNALVSRKNLARTSQTPGRTQTICFFNLDGRLMLVDLPGYGHAAASHADKHKWNALAEYYMKTRPNLRAVCLLLDARHGALANDLSMMQFLDRIAVSYQIVLTKTDRLKAMDLDAKKRQVEALLARRPSARPAIIMTSAEKGDGLGELRAFLAGFAG